MPTPGSRWLLGDRWVVDFPSLGLLATDWVAQHCIVPDRQTKGAPFVWYDWQLWCGLNHYRVRPDAKPAWIPVEEGGQLGTAFQYRRSQVVAPQKSGKGPWSASVVCVEGAGPALFAGWAGDDDGYACAEWGCGCGWEYPYEPGEPMGMPWATPLIQLVATAEDQVDNVYRPLQTMVKEGPLGDFMKVGEEFIRIRDDGRIDVVTSSATSRLGQPITFALQDESGLYTKRNGMVAVAETQRRGVAGMGGRSMETTNAWDPSQNSTAQRTAASRRPDIFRYHELPPPELRYRIKAERRKIHTHVYAGSPHVDLDGIEAEAAELLELDPAQAERFFGNRVVAGLGTWMTDGLWASREKKPPVLVPAGAAVCGGFDGSETNDHTGIRLETFDGYRFTPTYGPDKRPTWWNPAEWGGSIPRGEVHAAWDEICRRYKVHRVYCDPKDWQSEIADWDLKHGAGGGVFVEWATYRVIHMHDALERSVTDLISGRSWHDACPITAEHVENAKKIAKPGDRYILGKPVDHQKIDMAMCDTLAHEAAADARAAGWQPVKPRRPMIVRR